MLMASARVASHPFGASAAEIRLSPRNTTSSVSMRVNAILGRHEPAGSAATITATTATSAVACSTSSLGTK